jgi:hypothetical protein
MTIRVGAKGVPFRYATGGLDMSASTGLTLNFTKPANAGTLQKTEATTNAVTAPAVALVNDPDLGNQPASTYMEFTTVAADFDVAGTWTVCGIYTSTTQNIPGSPVEFEILPACS